MTLSPLLNSLVLYAAIIALHPYVALQYSLLDVMIPQIFPLGQQESWQLALKEAITDINELCEILHLNPQSLALPETAHQFPLRVPRSFVARMEKGNPTDPLLLQILPTAQEFLPVPGFTQDPLQEKQFNPLPGLLHKYHGRVLVTLSGACALHCRYCFRRHYPYSENIPGKKQFSDIIEYLKEHTDIQEVILSGGDPLATKDSYLETISEQLQTISHLTTWRIHTRFPIAIPERLTDHLLHILQNTRLRSVFVVHCNHPNEIDNTLHSYFKKLQSSGVTALNQTVLLKGINDNIDTLEKLSQRLFDIGILPYYLHLLDPVEGAAHFSVEISHAKDIMQGLLKRLPGYLIPKLVEEKPHALSKIPLPLL